MVPGGPRCSQELSGGKVQSGSRWLKVVQGSSRWFQVIHGGSGGARCKTSRKMQKKAKIFFKTLLKTPILVSLREDIKK